MKAGIYKINSFGILAAKNEMGLNTPLLKGALHLIVLEKTNSMDLTQPQLIIEFNWIL